MFFRYWLLVFAAGLTTLSIAHFFAEYNRLYVEKGLVRQQKDDESNGLTRLEQSAQRAVRLYPFTGGMNSAYAGVLSFKRSGKAEGDEDGDIDQEIIQQQERELISSRKSSLIWAALAANLNYSGQRGFEYRYAFNSAIHNGKFEYDTARMVLGMGVRGWPGLSCEEKRQVLEIVRYAESVNDTDLIHRNTSQGFSQLRKYLQELSERYEFDQNWALLEVSRCP